MFYLWAALVFIGGELLALGIFALLRKRLGWEDTRSANFVSAAKGILERLTLLTGLLHGFPHIIIAFGALKLGTRLHDEKDSNLSNTYFLVGNLVSILLAMIYAAVTRGIAQTAP